jgi:hypothetical protein
MKSENQSEIEEAFFLSFDWFYKELDALRHTPVEACKLEGNINVAHEIWYLLPNEHLLENPLNILTREQLNLLADLFNEVKSIPPEARIWTMVGVESVKNLSHPAWITAREKAQTVYLALAPVANACENFFRTNK